MFHKTQFVIALIFDRNYEFFIQNLTRMGAVRHKKGEKIGRMGESAPCKRTCTGWPCLGPEWDWYG
jgi:hypothetical protein